MESRKSSASGKYRGYYVEVRLRASSLETAHLMGDKFIVTKEWQKVPVTEVPFWGVRNELWEWSFYPHARDMQLMTWETANAIAAQVAAAHHMHSFLMEFRFIEVEVTHSYSSRSVKAGASFDYGSISKAQNWETIHEQTDVRPGPIPSGQSSETRRVEEKGAL